MPPTTTTGAGTAINSFRPLPRGTPGFEDGLDFLVVNKDAPVVKSLAFVRWVPAPAVGGAQTATDRSHRTEEPHHRRPLLEVQLRDKRSWKWRLQRPVVGCRREKNDDAAHDDCAVPRWCDAWAARDGQSCLIRLCAAFSSISTYTQSIFP